MLTSRRVCVLIQHAACRYLVTGRAKVEVRNGDWQKKGAVISFQALVFPA